MNIVLSMAVPALVAFAAAILLGYLLIPVLHKLKFGQYIREEGPEAHKKKAGTPTMGGIIFLLAFVIALLVFPSELKKFWIVPAMTLAFGIVGWLDDFIKIVLKHNEGLKPWQKFSLQLIAVGGFALYLYLSGFGTSVTFHVFNKTVNLGVFYYVLVILGMLGLDNGTNFTDGLDGLSSSVTLVISVFLAAASLVLGKDMQIPAAAFAGALMGFLYFNAYPAKVFMGDTGALALGGFVGSMAFLMDMPFMLLIFGFIYVAEVLSVMLQVGYFKLTHGKRLFKMAPIHHHFELLGWHETRVVAVFTLVTAVLSILSLIILAV